MFSLVSAAITLAETFCDIERSAGTCYKAAGWIPLGQTQGFTRVNRQGCDFYVPNDRPKAVWAKPLCKDALELLNARALPEDCIKGARGDARGVMPLGAEATSRSTTRSATCATRGTGA